MTATRALSATLRLSVCEDVSRSGQRDLDETPSLPSHLHPPRRPRMDYEIPHTRSSHVLALPPDYAAEPDRADLLSLDTACPFHWSVLEGLLVKARRAVKRDDDSTMDDDVTMFRADSSKTKRKASSPVRSADGRGDGPGELVKRVKKEDESSPSSSSCASQPTTSSSRINSTVATSESDHDSPQPDVAQSFPLFCHTLCQAAAVPQESEPPVTRPSSVQESRKLKNLRSELAEQLEAKDRFLSLLDRHNDEHPASKEGIDLGEVFLFPFNDNATLLTRPQTVHFASSVRLSEAEKARIEQTRIMDCLFEQNDALATTLEEADFPLRPVSDPPLVSIFPSTNER